MVAEQAHASQRIGDDEMQKATAVSQRIPSTSCRSLRARRPRQGQMEEARARGAPWVFRRKMSCAGQAIASARCCGQVRLIPQFCTCPFTNYSAYSVACKTLWPLLEVNLVRL
jgi:hypothetical protein